ncbi:MAG: metallophosphoesterase [Clostridia bacterium]|nr:metallophosphoesterase [Clostridia bacterium]
MNYGKSSKIKILSLLLVLMIVSSSSLISTSAKGYDELKIGIIGDQTGSYDLNGSYKIMSNGVSVLQNYKPDMIIHTGDLIESSLPEDTVKQNYNEAAAILNKSGVPWYITPGDHDVNPPQYKQNSPDHSREKLFQSLYKNQNPLVKNNLYYSFDKKKYHFISLYSFDHLHVDPRWGNVFLSHIDDAQYKWLKNDLEANKNKSGIIVFLHHPMWYNWSSWSRIHQLLRAYSVKAVIAGHFHYSQDEGMIDGIRYMVIGSTGGTIKNTSANSGGIQQVALMSVKNKTVTLDSIDLNTHTKAKMNTRFTMDRIQALDVVLGNLWNFESLNNVYLKGDKLVNSPDSSEPAKLSLKNIGNPLDLPTNISISLRSDSPSIKLVTEKFADDIPKASQSANGTCTLEPSYRVFSSNTSTVNVNGDPSLSALWEGTLGIEGALPPVGSKIYLDISMTFKSDDGELRKVQKTVLTTLKAVPVESK